MRAPQNIRNVRLQDMDKYTGRSHAHRRKQARRGSLRRWIMGSAAVAFVLAVLNAVLLVGSNFPGQRVSAAAPGVDFTDFLFVTAAPLFLWAIGLNTYAVWTIRSHSARIADLLERRSAGEWEQRRHGAGAHTRSRAA